MGPMWSWYGSICAHCLMMVFLRFWDLFWGPKLVSTLLSLSPLCLLQTAQMMPVHYLGKVSFFKILLIHLIRFFFLSFKTWSLSSLQMWVGGVVLFSLWCELITGPHPCCKHKLVGLFLFITAGYNNRSHPHCKCKLVGLFLYYGRIQQWQWWTVFTSVLRIWIDT